MPAFLVGTVRVQAPEPFARYAAAIKGLAATFGGEPVVAGPVTEVFEGASPVGERVVVTRFPSAEDARSYLNSSAYLAAKELRAGAADIELRLIEVQ
ncbi:MAG: DUF1330 domain-containing protein [Rhizomicrobium sp.]